MEAVLEQGLGKAGNCAHHQSVGMLQAPLSQGQAIAGGQKPTKTSGPMGSALWFHCVEPQGLLVGLMQSHLPLAQQLGNIPRDAAIPPAPSWSWEWVTDKREASGK